MIVYVAPIDGKHLPRHPLISSHAAFQMAEKGFGDFVDLYIFRIGAIGAISNLALDFYPELVRCPTGLKLWPVAFPCGVGVVNTPGFSLGSI